MLRTVPFLMSVVEAMRRGIRFGGSLLPVGPTPGAAISAGTADPSSVVDGHGGAEGAWTAGANPHPALAEGGGWRTSREETRHGGCHDTLRLRHGRRRVHRG